MSRKIKKVISVLVIATLFVMSFAGISLSYVSAAADVTAPIVDVSTLRVSQKTATAGDTVKVSVKVTDETEINSVRISYRRPKTNNNTLVWLDYNAATGYYDGDIKIEENSEDGLWKIDYIYVSDKFYNSRQINNTNVNSYGENADLSIADFEVMGTVADITAPIVDVSTLGVSQKTATAGDTVKVSVKVTDETEINSVRISYRRPKTNNNTLVWLDYNAATGYYDGDIKIEENSEDGLWKIDYIYVSDKFYNSRQINNTNVNSYGENADLSIADFEVMGTVADITAPIVDVSTLGVSQKTATAGDTVKVSVKVTDETEINSVRISYRRPKTNNNTLVWLDYNAATGYYDGDIKIEENSEDGLWKIDYIYVSDKFYNSRQINNTNVNSYGENADLSIADFEVVEDNRYNTISPLENVTVYTSNTTVSNATINGDVYIGPEAVVTLSNVTVTGNIYVLGGLRASSINAVSLYARYMSFSYITSYRHGEVSISGSNSFTGTTSFASNYCPEVPFRIDEAINKDGKLYIKGATAQIADMYILGTKININNNGRFVLEGIDVQDAEYITIQWVMYDGSKQERKVVLSDENGNIPLIDINISESEMTIKEGESVTLTTTCYPDNTTFSKKITWSSSDTNVATVDANGTVTAKSAGTAIITATTENGKTASCTVTVEKKLIPITEVCLDKSSATLTEGETTALTATVLPENTTDSKNVSWSSSNSEVAIVDANGTVTAKSAGTAVITAITENGKTASCTVTVNKKDTYTGLRDVDGQLKYFNNGNIDTTYTGFADYECNRYYVSNGVVDTTYTSLILDNGNWVYVENGKVNNDYTGLVNYDGLWFYVDNGTIDWGYTGLADYNGIWFYVSGGIVDWNYTGLTYYNDVWFYISGGMIDWDYTGLVYYNDIWFYVSGGILDWDYIGLTSYNGIWFMISGGMINWDYAGLVYYNDMWFYVSGGTINWDYAGLIYYNDAWFYVSGGTINWTTAIVDYNGAKFYVQNGMVDWDYTGTVNYNGSTYNVINGMA